MTRYGHPVMFEAVFRALNDRGVRYLVAGGVAVVLHGYIRFTRDLDLLVSLSPFSAEVITALSAVGFDPPVRVTPGSSPNSGPREAWLHEKGMTLFTLRHSKNPLLAIDLFTTRPVDFDTWWSASDEVQLETTTVRIVALRDLIRMKREAGRPLDLLDVDELEQIKRLKEDGA